MRTSARRDVAAAAVRIEQLAAIEIDGHGVDGEIAAREVASMLPSSSAREIVDMRADRRRARR